MGLSRLKSSCAVQIKAIGGDQLLDAGEDLTRFADDPEGLIRYMQPNGMLSQDQREILRSYIEEQETNVQAAHGVGKTWLLAWIVIHFVKCLGGVALTTAPTYRQVEMLLWRYIRSNYDRNKKAIGGRRTSVRLFLDNDCFGEGFSTSNYDANTFQGVHSKRLLIVFDEANGISSQIDDGAASCLTGSDTNKIIRVGNPVSSGTAFDAACKMGHIRIPVWSHPNVVDFYELHSDGIHRLKPDIAEKILRDRDDPQYKRSPVKPQKHWPEDLPRDAVEGAVSVEWIEKIRSKKGERSPYWVSRVEGLFPEDSGSAILPQSYFLAARARYDLNPALWETIINVNTPWSFGVDVGSMSDDHAICGFQGNVLKIARVIPCIGDRKDVVRIAQVIEEEYLQVYPNCKVGIDATGVGSGTLAYLLDRGWGAQVWAANFGDAVEEDANQDFDQLYMNWKAQWYWKLREFFAAADGNDDISAIAPLEEEEYLMTDFSNVYYEETPNAKLRIEDKTTKTIRRLGRSPNCSDACVIAFAGRETLMDTLWRSGY